MANSRKEISDCPVETALTVLGGRWKAQILWHLMTEGPLHYADLKRRLSGVAERVFHRQLGELVADGVVERRPEPDRKGRVCYALTDCGATLGPIMGALREWGAEHQKAVQTGGATGQD